MVETKIISRYAHHTSGKFMSDVFTDISYICISVAIALLYIFIYAWLYYLEDHKLKPSDFIHFVGNLVNQPFPTKMFNITRISSIILLRTFDIFTFMVVLMFGSTMIYKVMSTEPVDNLIDSLSQLEQLEDKQVYIQRNSFVHDVIDDIESLKSINNAGYFIKSLLIAYTS